MTTVDDVPGDDVPVGDVIVERCPARAALAGNPSDGYGGAVFSIPVRPLQATVRVIPTSGVSGRDDGSSDQFVLAHVSGPAVRFDSWDELSAVADHVSVDDEHALLLASIRVLADRVGPLDPMMITMDTTIPRSVGLAGSSAIVIAGLRALNRWSASGVVDTSGVRAFPPDELASLALHVERDLLGIAAGLQDRVVQAHDQPMLMRFDAASRRRVGGYDMGSYRSVPPAAGGSESAFRLFVAHRADAAEPSQVIHGKLRDRFERAEHAVMVAMTTLADLAEQAAGAFAVGDAATLGAAMDGSFDVRRTIVDVRPSDVEMIDAARAAGAHANYSGSGGTIVVLSPTEVTARHAVTALEALGAVITVVS